MLPSDPGHILLSTLDPGVAVSRIDLRDASRALVQESRTYVTRWFADPNGVVRGGWLYDPNARNGHHRQVSFIARSGADDSWHTVMSDPVDGRDESEFAGFDPRDADRVLFGIDGPHGYRVVRAWHITSGQPAEIVAEATGADVEPITRNQRLIGFGTAGTAQRFTYLDPAWQHDALAIAGAIGEGTVELLDRSEDGRHVLASLHDGVMPPEFWMLDRSGAKTTLHPVLRNYETITASQIGPSNWITYPARDGKQIPALLTLPPDRPAEPLPLVMLPHGGPHAHDELGFDWIAQFLASRGYGVLQPQFRSSTGFGEDLYAAGMHQWGQAVQNDVADGARYAIAHHIADPRRVAIVGASFGGYCALEGVVREPGLYRAAAAFAPVSDLAIMTGYRRFARPDLNVNEIAETFEDERAASPVHDAERISVPVLIAHGRQDFTVPIAQSQMMVAALRRAGKEVQALYLDDADHYFSNAADRVAWLQALEGFLAANMAPGRSSR